jgi:hypothetical protein
MRRIGRITIVIDPPNPPHPRSILTSVAMTFNFIVENSMTLALVIFSGEVAR